MILRRLGLKLRLTLWYSSVLTGLLVAVSLGLYFTVSHQLYQNLDRSLEAVGKALARGDLHPRGGLSEALLGEILRDLPAGSLFDRLVRVFDPAGRLGWQSLNVGGQRVPLTRQALENARRGQESYETFIPPEGAPIRVFTGPILRGGRVINLVQVGASLEEVLKTLGRLRLILFTALPAAVLLAALGGFGLARRALRPVEEVAETARRITADRLDERIPRPPTDDELGRLVDTLNEMISRLQAAFERVREFTADASHELKTPLTILQGEAELLLRAPRSGEDYRRGLEDMLEEVRRMGAIVEDLLTLAKADAGAEELDLRPVDLGDLVEEVFQEAASLPQAAGHTLRLEGKEPLVIRGDPYRLRQMIMNLLLNALHYTPSGGQVGLSLTHQDGRVLLRVSDTGVGISAEEIARVFDRFYRTASARRGGGSGSGLGLSICRWVAEAHRGTIRVESEPGRGSTFTVELPLEAAAESP